MDEQPTTPISGPPTPPPGSTNPYSSYWTPSGPPPEGPPGTARTPSPEPRRPRSRRAGIATAVVATAAVFGGAAGVGGAAAWSALDDSPSASAVPTTSQVVDTPAAAAPDGSVQQVAAKVLPSVVKINVSGPQGAGSGSGIILSSDGNILTNNHVVELAGQSGAISVSFNDGSSAKATILGTDPLTDTAVIKAEDVSGLTPATIGKSGDLQVGQGVVAIGSPFGLESTVTSGIVSALDRPVDVGSDGNGNSTTYPAIQTDAAINPGNSGGPLVDLNGNVVGIDSAIRTASSSQGAAGSIGLGFAIPIDEVMPIVKQMVNGEVPTHARLGISVSNAAANPGFAGPEGAAVQEVNRNSTAADAGLARGDVITKVDDHQITGADSLVATIRSYRPGDKVSVTFLRDGDTKTVTLELDSDAATSNS